MGILQELLKEIKGEELTQQVRVICDKIYEEEKHKMQYPQLAPKGPRIFLTLEVPGRHEKEIGFVSLEREDNEVYVVRYSTLEKYRIDKENIEDTVPPRIRKVWIIDENKAEKILTKFAKTVKMLIGE
jgi:hypothetical protein